MYLRRKRTIHRKQYDAEMETSAIGDMAFLLLIFFIVTSSFMMKQGIFLSLPSASGSAVKVEKEQIFEVTPLASGYRVDNRILNDKEVETELISRKQNMEDMIYIVYMQPDIPYQRLVDSLSIAGRAKVTRISVKDEEERENP